MIKSHGSLFLLLLCVFGCLHNNGCFVNALYGCKLQMYFDRVEENTADGKKPKKCTKGKFKKLYSVLNRVAKANGYPEIDMSDLDHSIEECGGDDWPWTAPATDYINCQGSTSRRALVVEEEEEGVVVEEFLTAMEGGGRRKLQSTCCDTFSCCSWCSILPGYWGYCSGSRRRRLGHATTAAATTTTTSELEQQHRQLTLTAEELAALEALKVTMKIELMNECDKDNLGCMNCTAPHVDFECTI